MTEQMQVESLKLLRAENGGFIVMDLVFQHMNPRILFAGPLHECLKYMADQMSPPQVVANPSLLDEPEIRDMLRPGVGDGTGHWPPRDIPQPVDLSSLLKPGERVQKRVNSLTGEEYSGFDWSTDPAGWKGSRQSDRTAKARYLDLAGLGSEGGCWVDDDGARLYTQDEVNALVKNAAHGATK